VVIEEGGRRAFYAWSPSQPSSRGHRGASGALLKCPSTRARGRPEAGSRRRLRKL